MTKSQNQYDWRREEGVGEGVGGEEENTEDVLNLNWCKPLTTLKTERHLI
jgi:hypothetical protein